jgi:23S rRNA (guanine745-N1)-methyltransferase
MAFRALPALRCPLDGLPLTPANGCLRCENAHTFDIARQGYVNLLGAQHKRSRDPGDSKAMIAARRRFLDAGFYRPLPEHLAQLLPAKLGPDSLIVDAGCGEGYYLDLIRQQLLHKGQPEPDILGFDISKWAVQSAARRFSATWVVASNRRIPLADRSADVILDAFGFPDFVEFSRILKPSGLLIRVEAGRQHLLELRQLIYESIEAHDDASAVPSGFLRRNRDNMTYTTTLSGNDTIADLLLMTPHLFRASAAGKQRVESLPSLTVTVDAVVDVLQKA